MLVEGIMSFESRESACPCIGCAARPCTPRYVLQVESTNVGPRARKAWPVFITVIMILRSSHCVLCTVYRCSDRALWWCGSGTIREGIMGG